jgi:hypothetical protein
LKQKAFSFVDLGWLSREAPKLEMTAGVKSAFGPMDLSDIGIHGDAWFITKIESTVVDKIWNVMGMSKSGPDSSYNEVMGSDDIGTFTSVFKFGGFFSAFYVGNLAITFDHMQVQVGSKAAKNPALLIGETHELLVGNKKFYATTDEAIQAL